MLNHLKITNLAIINDMEIDCSSGLTVITGETGAGKSILLDALNLVLGARADASLVKHGSDRADVLASFDLGTIPEAQRWLAEKELDADDECILRRVVTREGRSRAYINSHPCPVQNLKELGVLLISIHGQHEHQRLLNKEHHRQLLDDSANLAKLSQQTKVAYQTWQIKHKALEQLRDHLQKNSDRVDLLTFQVSELDALNLADNELEQLAIEHQRLANAETLIHSGNELNTILESNNSDELKSQGVLDLLNTGLAQLGNINIEDDHLRNVNELLHSALIQAQEAKASLQSFLDGFEADPVRLQTLDERLSTIHKMARKHRIQPQQLTQLHHDLTAELGTLEQGDDAVNALQGECEGLLENYLNCAEQLRKKRKTAAKKLSKAITKEMSVLGMPHGRFEVTIDAMETGRYTSSGIDQVEFLVSANPDQPVKPLQKTASGGELSRISLAIQVVCANKSQVATLVFDEVDVGISGGIAQVVGRLLRGLGSSAQILCITHVPQVASQGHQHWHVGKTVTKRATRTHIAQLDEEEKVQAIATMLGGEELTDKTLDNARDLLSQRA